MKKNKTKFTKGSKSFFKLPEKVEGKNPLPFTQTIWISVFISLLNILIVILLKSHLPPEVPLYYGLAESQDQLAKSYELIIPGVVSLVIAIINLTLARFIVREYIRKVLIITIFCVSFLSLITVLKIIFLVGSF